MTYYATNINSTEAKLFAIRYRINYAIYLSNVNCIIIIIDAIPAVRWIIDMLIHPYQLHFIAISKDLKKFFNKDPNNIIKFLDCPDNVKWSPYMLVNEEIKHFQINPVFPRKSLRKFSRKEECDSIV